jgi:hypothetical protein
MEVHLKKYAYKGFILIWLVMGLSGCATPYGSSAGNYLGGFSEAQLGENMFQVSFEGNAYTKADTVANYTLLRSAELTLQYGFTHFIVVDKADLSRSGSFTTPTSSSTTGSASIIGNTVTGSSTTQFYGGQTYAFKKPGASNTIVCFNDKPQIGGAVYDAAFLVQSLKVRYQIPSSAISASIPSSQQSGNDLDTLRAKLEELQGLVADGLITKDDYEKKKADLINQLD